MMMVVIMRIIAVIIIVIITITMIIIVIMTIIIIFNIWFWNERLRFEPDCASLWFSLIKLMNRINS